MRDYILYNGSNEIEVFSFILKYRTDLIDNDNFKQSFLRDIINFKNYYHYISKDNAITLVKKISEIRE